MEIRKVLSSTVILGFICLVGCSVSTSKLNSQTTNVSDVAQHFANNGYEGSFKEEPMVIMIAGMEQAGELKGKGFDIKIVKWRTTNMEDAMRQLNHTYSLMGRKETKLFGKGYFSLEVVTGDAAAIGRVFEGI